ncbi:MAG TPA: polymer-forming cytoskeletal protein [Thermoanaerobaculia bacterium]|nr:polymer-forming cytoskeletal protein [Thermoanaerobaculia bacterium]
MSISIVDPYGKRYRRRLGAAALIFALGLPLVFAALAVAQETPAVQGQELRRQIESRYQVVPIRGGVVLTPRQASRGVRAIEVSGDAVAINGERVNAQIARDWLGEDARLILPLLDLDPAARRELFGMTAEAAPPAPPEPPEAPETPETPETPAEETPEEIEVETPASPEVPEVPEAPEPVIHSGSRVKFGGSILVEKEELAEEAVAIGGSVRVDGQVSRDVVAIGGPARINGHVGGDVVSVGSSVYLGPDAVVEGDVNSTGGTIERSPGSQIHGSTSEVGAPWGGPWRDGRDFDPPFGPFSLFGASMEAFGSIVWMATLALLTCLTLLIARRPLEQVDLRLKAEPLKSALVGLSSLLASVPLIIVVLGILFVVSVILVLLLVGCLLLILLPFFAMALVLALMLALVLGYSASAYRVGRWLEERYGRSFGGPYAAALVGVLVIQIWSVIGHLLSWGPGALDLFASMFVMFGWFVQLAAWVMGFGAVLLARFGAPTRFVPPTVVPATIPPPPYPPATHGGDLPLTDRTWEEPPPER